MNAFVYRADLYCEDCARDIIAKLRDGKLVYAGLDSEDSDDFPQGPYANGGGEADNEQHCGGCNVALENPLTTDGEIMRMERIADAHNMEIWQDDAVEYGCDGCHDTGKLATKAAVEANGGCPDCGEPISGPVTLRPSRWWFWCCSPGCLPEGEPQGPYGEYGEALEASIEGLDD